MPIYCVSYDLNKEGKNYEELYEKLKSYDSYCHMLESTWFIVTKDGASKIREFLREVMDEDDELIVIEVVKNWASYSTDDKHEWFKRNLKKY